MLLVLVATIIVSSIKTDSFWNKYILSSLRKKCIHFLKLSFELKKYLKISVENILFALLVYCDIFHTVFDMAIACLAIPIIALERWLDMFIFSSYNVAESGWNTLRTEGLDDRAQFSRCHESCPWPVKLTINKVTLLLHSANQPFTHCQCVSTGI